MAYLEARAHRHAPVLPHAAPDLGRATALILVFAAVAGLVAWSAPATAPTPAGLGWHGNVAASQ